MPFTCGDMKGNRLDGSPLLLDFWLTTFCRRFFILTQQRNIKKPTKVCRLRLSSPLFRHFQESLHCSSDISKKVSKSLWTFPKGLSNILRSIARGSPIPSWHIFMHVSVIIQHLLYIFPSNAIRFSKT